MKVLSFALKSRVMLQVKSKNYYLPSNLDLDALIAQSPPHLSDLVNNPHAVKMSEGFLDFILNQLK